MLANSILLAITGQTLLALSMNTHYEVNIDTCPVPQSLNKNFSFSVQDISKDVPSHERGRKGPGKIILKFCVIHFNVIVMKKFSSSFSTVPMHDFQRPSFLRMERKEEMSCTSPPETHHPDLVFPC